jgi:hypothetical protein
MLSRSPGKTRSRAATAPLKTWPSTTARGTFADPGEDVEYDPNTLEV